MPTPAIPQLTWSYLTGVINEIKSPNRFLQRVLFPTHQTVPTETIEYSTLSKARETAPFVRVNGEAITVGGTSHDFRAISAPNIRVKKPFTPNDLLFNRQPGTPVFVSGAAQVIGAVEAHIMRDMQAVMDLITNAKEYMCALALQGTITYSVADQEVFTITYPKPGANTITLSTFWNDADPTKPRPLANILAVKRVMTAASVPAPTDCVLGQEASDSLLELAESGNIKLINAYNLNDVGTMSFVNQFDEDGVIYLGSLGGIRFWEYSRTALVNGVSTPMIRAKYAEFFSQSSFSERVMYFGAIPDMTAFQSGLLQAEQFAKSWLQEDPSSLMSLVHTRPLPVPRRAAATVSMKVVSG